SPERVVSMLIVQKHLSARRGRRAMQEGREAVEQELWTILFDPECRDGLATVVGKVRRTAEVVRERLSFDTFRILRDLTEVIHAWKLSPGHETDDALRLLNRLIQYLAAFNGMVMENMTRGYGWRFLDMGRRLERLRTMIQLIQQLAVRGDPESDGALELLLELADSTMTYRGRYQAAPRVPGVLDLLLSDETNPRSAVFQIVTLSDHMSHLPSADDDGILTPDQRITTRLGNDLRLADPAQLGETVSRFEARIELDRLARRVDRAVQQLSDHIADRFFSHSSAKRVSGARREEPSR
ncbi:MAG TPA: alpha-E domain-containing protein, partial [Gammaproteobacteria bacterium]|nr:alpha-E domain-containing protein [Gammaproteobacteria bacterium]